MGREGFNLSLLDSSGILFLFLSNLLKSLIFKYSGLYIGRRALSNEDASV